MIIGFSRIELYLPGIKSLKEKRSILTRIKTTVRNSFNVSISEVDYQDKWQRTLLGIVGISNDKKVMESTLTKILNNIERIRGIDILDSFIEVDYGIQTKKSKFDNY